MIDPDAMKEFSARHPTAKAAPPTRIIPPLPREPSPEQRIAAALERIADALDRAVPREIEDRPADELEAQGYIDAFQAFPTPERIRAEVEAQPDLEPAAVLLSAILASERYRRGTPPADWRQTLAVEVIIAFGGRFDRSGGSRDRHDPRTDRRVLALLLKAGVDPDLLVYWTKDFEPDGPDWNALAAMPYSTIIGGDR